MTPILKQDKQMKNNDFYLPEVLVANVILNHFSIYDFSFFILTGNHKHLWIKYISLNKITILLFLLSSNHYWRHTQKDTPRKSPININYDI